MDTQDLEPVTQTTVIPVRNTEDCIICYEVPTTIIQLPCCRKYLCGECATEHWKNRTHPGNVMKDCPHCRRSLIAHYPEIVFPPPTSITVVTPIAPVPVPAPVFVAVPLPQAEPYYNMSHSINLWNQFKANNPDYVRPLPGTYQTIWTTVDNYDYITPRQHPYVLGERISYQNELSTVSNVRPLPHILRVKANWSLDNWLEAAVLYDTCTATTKVEGVITAQYRVHQYYWKESDTAIIGRCGYRGCNYTLGPTPHTCFRIRVPITQANTQGTIGLMDGGVTDWNMTKYYRCPDHTAHRDVRYSNKYNTN
jgi:hypothetical protein